ncbi:MULTISPECIES: M20 metallopeptidase family protein [Psychrilyobacter]|uniref:Amidohydrolase n=1 Tax=Psychrilyobacter piezotolerans TaxID=2293438 RepID=A0ABX9KFW1_9FUSO|nr:MULTISPECIES: amidohydrolase [Psychrilyobacter]MCS5422841.1 amidohydrolase [Psychrilyobacter sp. S5]NDI78379.1 amidohydrolase [Psychrilyobacter piezotolerans]RDE61106.1 amidohydrolase [Psychrilyobacter sp. S5]REI40747.1 amidohydrolase [Psychrilyobacter piezotolerans]
MDSNKILELAKEISPWLSEVRRDFHMYPELGMEELRTQRKICEYLDEFGILYKKMAKTGVVGEIKGKGAVKTIALRADMDALPILEKNHVSYRSKNNGVMHACGHDAHTAILLGAAKILSEKQDELGVNVRFIFQPAEETVGGAEPMIKEGALEGVDAIFGLHVSSEIEKGSVEYRYKQMNASSDSIEIEIRGVSAHGAYPGEGVDAIVITAQLITAMQSIVSRIDARDSAVLTMGMIAGGTAPNIIADSVKLMGTLRTLDPQVRKLVKEKLRVLVETLPVSMGGKGILKIEKGYSSLINDDKMVDLVKRNAVDILGVGNVLEKEKANMGVEDFGYYLEKIPGVFFYLGVKNEKKGIAASAHNGFFDIDEDALHLGVAIQILNVLSV